MSEEAKTKGYQQNRRNKPQWKSQRGKGYKERDEVKRNENAQEWTERKNWRIKLGKKRERKGYKEERSEWGEINEKKGTNLKKEAK